MGPGAGASRSGPFLVSWWFGRGREHHLDLTARVEKVEARSVRSDASDGVQGVEGWRVGAFKIDFMLPVVGTIKARTGDEGAAVDLQVLLFQRVRPDHATARRVATHPSVQEYKRRLDCRRDDVAHGNEGAPIEILVDNPFAVFKSGIVKPRGGEQPAAPRANKDNWSPTRRKDTVRCMARSKACISGEALNSSVSQILGKCIVLLSRRLGKFRAMVSIAHPWREAYASSAKDWGGSTCTMAPSSDAVVSARNVSFQNELCSTQVCGFPSALEAVMSASMQIRKPRRRIFRFRDRPVQNGHHQ